MITLTEDIVKLPYELYLYSLLQTPVRVVHKNRELKTGRLLLYKRIHFCVQLMIETKRVETLELPIPFNAEQDSEINTIFFDYRLANIKLRNNPLPFLNNSVRSVYYDSIVEICPIA
jgi:hypothetical protein